LPGGTPRPSAPFPACGFSALGGSSAAFCTAELVVVAFWRKLVADMAVDSAEAG
jgi:hypothetical protein